MPIAAARGARSAQPALIRPRRIQPGDVFGIVSPATAAFETDPTEIFADAIRAVGLEPRLGSNYYRRRGYFAGTDAERAADIMEFFADPEVKGIFARGGWGSARVLPLLDYDVIRANPKVLLGYSDATALLTGVHAKTGLIVMHGPGPGNRFSTEHFRRTLMEGEADLLENLVDGPWGSHRAAGPSGPHHHGRAGDRAAPRRQPDGAHRDHGFGVPARLHRRHPVPRGRGRGGLPGGPDDDHPEARRGPRPDRRVSSSGAAPTAIRDRASGRSPWSRCSKTTSLRSASRPSGGA